MFGKLIAAPGVGTVRQQRFHDWYVCFACCDDESRVPGPVLPFQFGAPAQQRFHDPFVTLLRGTEQRCVAEITARVNRGGMGEQPKSESKPKKKAKPKKDKAVTIRIGT